MRIVELSNFRCERGEIQSLREARERRGLEHIKLSPVDEARLSDHPTDCVYDMMRPASSRCDGHMLAVSVCSPSRYVREERGEICSFAEKGF